MSEQTAHWCVFLPCSAKESWAIPQKCLAEIVTVPDAGAKPPAFIEWRGESVPVLDIDEDNSVPFRHPVSGTGLVAVILGLKGQGNQYWAIAVRGEGLGLKNLSTEQITEVPERAEKWSTAAFELNNVVYQVPDLPELQKQMDELRLSA